MKVFFLTARFLTRLPFPDMGEGEILPKETFAKGIVFFPLIGLIIGFLCWIVYCFFYKLTGSLLLAAVFAVLTQILVTGAFHLDGLADTCDGLFSSRQPDRMLEIMRDSRLGTNGAIAVLFDVIIKIVMLYEAGMVGGSSLVLLFPVAGKTAVPILVKTVYARKEGLGNIYIGTVKDSYLIGTVFFGGFLLLLGLGSLGILPYLAVLLTAYVFRRYAESKIGGMTGDTLGAGSELAELAFLLMWCIERWL